MSKKALKVIAGAPDRPLRIGDVEIQCYVLEGETRVLTRSGFLTAIGRARAVPSRVDDDETPSFLAANNIKTTPLAVLDLAVLLLDGVHVGTHCIVVALGIDVTGQKHALGVWECATENTTVCQGLLSNLQSRGLRTDRRRAALGPPPRPAGL